MLVFSEWLNANEVRRYPLHDSASGELQDNILVDARLWVPKSAGRVVYVSSVGITSGLVTLTFLAAADSPFLDGTGTPVSFTPLAVVRASRPVTRFVNMAVEALYPGVGGWIALGEGAVEIESLNARFTGPAETQLNERCVNVYDDAAVSSVGKENVAEGLTGLITLRGEAGVLKTFKATRTVEGVDREVAVVAMDLGDNKVSRLQDFSGVCGGRPQANTCRKRVVERINTVTPDDDGNIDLVFEGDMTVGDVQRGLIVDFPVGLDDVCPESISNEIPFPVPGGPPSPTPPEPPPEPSGSSGQSDSSEGLPSGYCEDFEDGVAEELDNFVGSFTIEDVPGRTKRYVSAADDTGQQLATNYLRQFNTEEGETYTVVSIIRPRSVDGKSFLIAGFKNDNLFTFAGITLENGGSFFVGNKSGETGGSFGSGYRPYLEFAPEWDTPPDTDYQVTFAIYSSDIAEMKVAWNDGIADREQTQLVVLASFQEKGRPGLGVLNSETEFDDFGVNCEEFPSSSSSSSGP